MSAANTYDIAIWDGIRYGVQWTSSTLVESIKGEISRDWSVSELQGLDPVPWQMREILRQRADSWVQRLYDICCDVHKRNGNQVSHEFDRAAWAYCVDPFIMREVETNEFGYRASVLMELLLCAVGSPASKRNLLRVCQKDCCLAVRLKIYETWYDKLHHFPPRIDQAARALANFHAIQMRAARIARGLPPEPSALPSSAPIDVRASAPDSPSVGLTENKPVPQGTLSLSKSAPMSIHTIDKNLRREAIIRKIRNPQANTIVSTTEAALYFEVEPRTIYRWACQGILKKGARRSSVTIESILQHERRLSRKAPN